MLRRNLFTGYAIGVVCVIAPCLVQAAPLDAIPDSASVVMRLKSPEKTIQKTVDLVNQLNPQWGALVQMQAQGLGMLISNPAMAGVDQSKDWWVAVFTTPDGEPGVVFMVPATDADALKKAVGSSYQFVEHENHVLYSQDEAPLEQIKARLKGDGQSILAVIDAESQGVLDRGDLSIFANVAQLVKTYSAQLDQADLMVDQGLGQISQATPDVAGMNMKAVWDMYGQIGHSLIQMVRDTTGYTLAVTTNPDAVIFEEFLRVNQGTAADQFFKTHAPADIALLDRFPADQSIYFGFHGNMKALASWGGDLAAAMYEGNEGMQKSMKAFLDNMDQVTWGSYAGSGSVGTVKGGLLRMMVAVEIEPVDKMKVMLNDMLENMADVQTGPIKQSYTIKLDAEKYGDHSVDIMNMKQEVDPSIDPMGMQKKILEIAYGPDGMNARLVYLPGVLVELIGGDQNTARDAIEHFEKDTEPNKAIQAARKQLSPKANLIFLLDLVGLAKNAADAVAAAGDQLPVPIPPGLMDGVEAGASYIGCSIATEPHAVRFKASIPVDQMKGIAQIVQKVMALAAAMKAPQP